MAVEILTVSLSDESIDRLAEVVAAKLGNERQWPNTERRETENASQADPWTGEEAPGPQNGSQGQPGASQSRPENTPPRGAPRCAHGEMRYVPGGFSQRTGKAYQAFYGCPAPRGAQDKCRSVTA